MDDLDFLAQQFQSTLIQPVKAAILAAAPLWQRPNKFQIISAIPILNSLNLEIQKAMAENSRILSFQRGLRVFAEGQKGTDLYFVLKGSLGIYNRNAEGKRAQVIALSKGSVFGEGGFFLGQPRTAEVMANENVTLLCFKRPAEFATVSPEIPTIAALDFQRKIWAFQTLIGSSLFNGVPSEFVFQILSQGVTVDINPQTVMMKEGDASDSFWFLLEGSFEVFVGGKFHRRLGPGSVIGEIGVIWNVNRTSTVRAVTKSVALRIAAEDMRGLLSQNLNIAVMLQELGSGRLTSKVA